MVASSVLGFPRIGSNREIKKAVELYWAGKIDAAGLEKAASDVKKANWIALRDRGVDFIPSNDFSLYDHVLDHSLSFDVIPKRYQNQGLSPLDVYFSMARGRQGDGIDVPACEMKKWFDSNYHYVVPEFDDQTQFNTSSDTSKALAEYREAKALGVETSPVITGPISYLLLGKPSKDASPDFRLISLLGRLLPTYVELLQRLREAGAEWVQLDEPFLVTDAGAECAARFQEAYDALAPYAPKIMLTTYYGRLESNVTFIAKLPVAGLHIDLDRSLGQLDEVIDTIKATSIILSLGLVSGRSAWKTNYQSAILQGENAIRSLGPERVVVATSCSLLHVPVTLAAESKLTEEQKDWMCFALEKVSEVVVIASALSGSTEPSIAAALEENKASISRRFAFEQQSDDSVRRRVDAIVPEQYHRQSSFDVRRSVQQKKLNFPRFPTTTLGSYPQTSDIRKTRAKLNKGEITEDEYEEFIKKEIESVVRFEENMELDLLVHGEPERNDMVQYFAEHLSGFVFTQNGWVQSYGTRCVRPPIIVTDISRKGPITVKWSKYAQSLTQRPMKGMLTGPVTILNWSFPRVDIPREVQAQQLALALRDEVLDLESAGIPAIQVDEPALREGLPLRRSDWSAYLTWAVNSFKLATSGVRDDTQVHSHFCYSDFGDVFEHIQQLEADVISIEASKSDMKVLRTFKEYGYANCIGPGVYDVHSPRVPCEEEIRERLRGMVEILDSGKLFVNPDCGLKTRGWKETESSLRNLVNAAKWARERYP